MALGGVGCAKRLAQVLYRVPERMRPRKVMACTDEDEPVQLALGLESEVMTDNRRRLHLPAARHW